MRSEISELVGKTIRAIENRNDELIFATDAGMYRMWHSQDCCESVQLEEVVGDLEDLIGSPVLSAEEVSSEGFAPDRTYDDSHTWTFYKLATIKGSVTLRWLGESNGYYSESVDFARIDDDRQVA